MKQIQIDNANKLNNNTKYMSDFISVDALENPMQAIDFLEAHNFIPGILAYKALVLDILQIKQQDRIIDIGCGTGHDAVTMATLVKNQGHVVAIDSSRTMIDYAQSRYQNSNLPISFKHSHAKEIDFTNDTFDKCRCDRVLQHVEEPKLALTEMRRIVRTGGRIIAIDPDWSSFIIDASNELVTHKILQYKYGLNGTIRNPWMGRKLYSLFKEADIMPIEIIPHTVKFMDFDLANYIFKLANASENALKNNLITLSEQQDWISNLTKKNNENSFFCSITLFIALGEVK